jgi:hypothetical protein
MRSVTSHHVAAVVDLGHNAVGAVRRVGIDRQAGPLGRRVAPRDVGQQTINELRQNEPPLWICREIDALVPEATHAIVSMRPDNPALKRIMLLAVSFIMKRMQGAQHAEVLAAREVKEAEALAKQEVQHTAVLAKQEVQHAAALAEREAKEVEKRRTQTVSATRKRSGDTSKRDALVAKIEGLGLSTTALLRATAEQLIKRLDGYVTDERGEMRPKPGMSVRNINRARDLIMKARAAG